MLQTCTVCDLLSSEYMRMLSRYIIMYTCKISHRVWFILTWKVAKAFTNSNNMTVYLK